MALIQVIKNLEGRTDLINKVILGTRATLEGRANLEIGVELENMQELGLATISMYCV